MVDTFSTASRTKGNTAKHTRTVFDKKKPLRAKDFSPILFLLSILILVYAVIVNGSNNDLKNQIDELTLNNSILQEQNNRLEEDVRLKNMDIEYLNGKIVTLENEKDNKINSLENMIRELDEEYSFLRKDKLNSDEVQIVLLSEKYDYTKLKGEDLLYLTQQIERYENLSSNSYMIDIILGLYEIESSCNPNADSSKSTARGLGQFLEGTGRWVWEVRLGNPIGSYSHTMAYDKKINMEMTCNYLSYLLEVYDGNVEKALIGYNGGELGSTYPRKIQNYVLAATGVDVFK